MQVSPMCCSRDFHNSTRNHTKNYIQLLILNLPHYLLSQVFIMKDSPWFCRPLSWKTFQWFFPQCAWSFSYRSCFTSLIIWEGNCFLKAFSALPNPWQIIFHLSFENKEAKRENNLCGVFIHKCIMDFHICLVLCYFPSVLFDS